MTPQEIIARNADMHPWRPTAYMEDMIPYFEKQGIPFCRDCADWHMPDEDHSLVP